MTYGSSTVNRQRRTQAQLGDLDVAIIAAVEAQYPISLRGVFYRVEAAGAIEKTVNGYRTVGRRLLALRRDGTVPYSHITDGTRWVIKPRTWTDLDEMLDDAGASYRRALWHSQRSAVHLFTEKDAITGVIEPVIREWDVPLGVLRGYCSESFAYSMAESIDASLERGKDVYVYQLGDHDPSGVDAWRDFQAKVTGFLGAENDWPLYFERLAVTEDQIEEFALATRPTKISDTRAAGFTGGSVEVDAIPPNDLRAIVKSAIIRHIDDEALRLTLVTENSERELFYAMRGGAP